MLSLALVGFIWQLIYSRDQGLLNAVLAHAAIDWYGDPNVNLWAVLVAASWRHTGYIMLLYLAGLKAVDPSLREAAAIDGATEVQTFFRVVFPVMRPINIIVLVVTVIESLRAFDLVWVINKGRNGLELIAALVTQQRRRRGEPDRLRLGAGHDHAADLARCSSSIYLSHRDAGGAAMTHRDRRRAGHRAAATAARSRHAARQARSCCTSSSSSSRCSGCSRWRWAVLNSFRDYAYTSHARLRLVRRLHPPQLRQRLGAGRLRPALPATR